MIFESNIFMYIVGYIIIPIILYMSVKRYNDKNNKNLTFESTQSIRGICIILIIIHHIVQRMKLPGILIPYRAIGYILVTIFFFLSGYALMMSLLNKNTYMSNFLNKRITKIYIPFVIINIINIVLDRLILGTEYNIKEMISYSIGIKLIDTVLWYIIASLILYIIFYICFFRGIKNYSIKLLNISIFIYISLCIFINMPTWWYNSILGFPIGIMYSINKTNINEKLSVKKSNIYFFTFSFIITFILANTISGDKMKLIFEVISSVLCTIALICISTKFNIKSRILTFIGSISFEMYLLHMKIYKYYFNSEKLYKSYDVIIYILIIICTALTFKKLIGIIFINKNRKLREINI